MPQQSGTVAYEQFGKKYVGTFTVENGVVTVVSEMSSKSRPLDGNPVEGWAQILLAEIVGAAFVDRRL